MFATVIVYTNIIYFSISFKLLKINFSWFLIDESVSWNYLKRLNKFFFVRLESIYLNQIKSIQLIGEMCHLFMNFNVWCVICSIFHKFSDIYEFMVIQVTCYGAICSTLLIFQMVKFYFEKFVNIWIIFIFNHLFQHTNSTVDLIRPIFLLLSCFVQIFLICDFGHKVCNQFIALEDSIYRINWYLLPIDLQRFLLIIMIASQKSVEIRGFGNISCTRETFKKVNFNKELISIQFGTKI